MGKSTAVETSGRPDPEMGANTSVAQRTLFGNTCPSLVLLGLSSCWVVVHPPTGLLRESSGFKLWQLQFDSSPGLPTIPFRLFQSTVLPAPQPSPAPALDCPPCFFPAMWILFPFLPPFIKTLPETFYRQKLYCNLFNSQFLARCLALFQCVECLYSFPLNIHGVYSL